MRRIREPEVLGRELRANPHYELVLSDRLEPELRRSLADLEKDPGFYGVLRSRSGSGTSVKAVDRDTALLFLTLREPGPLPSYVRRIPDAADTVARLVADGVLEIATEGGFV